MLPIGKKTPYHLLFLGLWLLAASAFSQPYVFNGNASDVGGGCWQITPPIGAQRGSIWSTQQIDLSQPFDIQWDLLFGYNNGGADGIAFVLQNQGTNVLGGTGGSLSFGGIVPSLGIEFDTWQNATDPAQDHIGIQRDGSTTHAAPNMIAAPVALGNFEDGQYHAVRMVWNPTTQLLQVYYDCTLIISTNYNVIGIFNGNPMVYWGFVGATGGAVNDQRACLRSNMTVNNGIQTVCQGDSLALIANSIAPSGSYTWTPNYALAGSGSTVMVSPAVDTVYQVQYLDACGNTHIDSFQISVAAPPTFTLGTDSVLCSGQSMNLTPSQGYPSASYLWSNASSATQITASQSGTYWLEMDNQGCTFRDSIDVTVLAPFNATLGPDRTICPGDTAFLDFTYPGTATYAWQDASTNPTYDATMAGQYYATATYGPGCTHTDTVEIYTHTVNPTTLPPTASYCTGQSYLLDPGQPTYSYQWSSGPTSTTLNVTSPANYSVIWTDPNGCIGYDTTLVTELPAPAFSLGNDTSICPGDTAFLEANILSAGLIYLWQDLSSDTLYFADTAGTYWLEIANSNTCTFRDSIVISEIQLPVVDLGVDRSKCPEDSIQFDATPTGSWSGLTYQWQNGPTTATHWAPTPGQYIATVGYQGCSISDTVLVSDFNVQPTTLPPTLTICPDESFTLDPGQPSYSYTWQDGSTGGDLTANSGGLYWLTFVDPDGCTGADSTLVTESTPPQGQLPTDTSMCAGSNILLHPDPIGNGTSFPLLWDDGSTGVTRRVFDPGTYWVQMTDQDGCIGFDSVNVTVDALPTINLATEDILCEGSITLIELTDPNLQYVWSTGDSTATLPVTAPGIYRVVFTDQNGCVNSDEIRIKEIPMLFVELGEDREVCGTSFTELDADPTGLFTNADFMWSTGERTSSVEVVKTGEYIVTLTNECFTASDSVNIELNTDIGVWVPSAFTPNGDGLNDVHQIGLLNVTDFEFQLYDRWGRVILTTNSVNAPWNGFIDGKPAQEGVYLYKINFTNCAGQPDTKAGSVTLIR